MRTESGKKNIVDSETIFVSRPFVGMSGVPVHAFVAFQALNCFLLFHTFPYAWDLSFLLKLAVLTLFPLAYSVFVFRWPFGVGGRFAKVSFDDDGIVVGGIKLPWDAVERVEHGAGFFRWYPMLALFKRRAEPRSFWSLDIGGVRVVIPGYSFVYDEMLLFLRRRRPDLEFPENIPSAASARRLRLFFGGSAALACASIQICVLLLASRAVADGAFLDSQFYALLAFIPALFSPFACLEPSGEPTGLAYLRGAVAGVGVSFFVGVYSFYLFSPPAWTLSVLMSFCVLSLSVGILVLLGNALGLRDVWRGGLWLAMLAFALFSYGEFQSSPPRTLDLSVSFVDESPLFVWSVDGRYMTDYSATSGNTRRFLIDTLSGEEISLPSHEYGDTVVWIGGGYVVRRAMVTPRSMGLFVFDIPSGRESKVDEAPVLSVSRLSPVSSDGRRLAWLASASKNAEPIVRIMDMECLPVVDVESRRVGYSKKIKWLRVDWSAREQLVVRGSLRDNSKHGFGKLALARLGVDSGETAVSVTLAAADIWYPLPGFERAFALTLFPVSGSDVPRRMVSYVDLTTGKTLGELSGGDIPSWISGRWAYRTLGTSDGNFFLRFDMVTGRESIVADISPRWILSGVSHDGRYALFALDSLITFSTFHLLDMEDGTWRRLELSGLAGFPTESGNLVLLDPRFSIWSPGSDTVVLESMEFNLHHGTIKFKTRLYPVEGGESEQEIPRNDRSDFKMKRKSGER